MRAEALMAVANVTDDIGGLVGDEEVLQTVVHLSTCSVAGRRGEGQAPIWAVRECLRPLVRLTVNVKNRASLANTDRALKVMATLLKRRAPAPSDVPTRNDLDEEVALSVIALARLVDYDLHLADDSACMPSSSSSSSSRGEQHAQGRRVKEERGDADTVVARLVRIRGPLACVFPASFLSPPLCGGHPQTRVSLCACVCCCAGVHVYVVYAAGSASRIPPLPLEAMYKQLLNSMT